MEDLLKFKTFQVPQESYFEIDIMQSRLLKDYLRKDLKFRKCYYTNYSNIFLQYLADKCKLREPISLSLMGSTRSGKSVSGISISAFIMHQFKKQMTVNHIVSNEYEYLDFLKVLKQDESIVIDESKINVYGSGSHSAQSKILNVDNTCAVNNISTINIRPDRFTKETNVSYGLRSFGRAGYICLKCNTKLDLEAGRIEWNKDQEKFIQKKPKICPKCGESNSSNFNIRVNRFMLYNLMESRGSHYVPCGMVYIGHAFDLLAYGERLEKEYLLKKQRWVDCEQNSTSDVLQDNKLRIAVGLSKDKRLKEIGKKQERFVYIGQKLGSDFTTNEVKEIQIMVDLVSRGLLNEKDLKK